MLSQYPSFLLLSLMVVVGVMVVVVVVMVLPHYPCTLLSQMIHTNTEHQHPIHQPILLLLLLLLRYYHCYYPCYYHYYSSLFTDNPCSVLHPYTGDLPITPPLTSSIHTYIIYVICVIRVGWIYNIFPFTHIQAIYPHHPILIYYTFTHNMVFRSPIYRRFTHAAGKAPHGQSYAAESTGAPPLVPLARTPCTHPL